MERDHRRRSTTIDRPAQNTASAVGKQTLTMALPDAAPERSAPVQRLATAASPGAAAVHAAAQSGLAGPSAPLPHLDRIQRLFGRHDVSHVQAHVGGPAVAASDQMGARAYATGHHVAFASSPDLHTAAHEAAHVVQQRAGVQLKDAVGSAGDSHEQHADAVADRVVRGESAEALLDQYSGGGGGGVQFSLIGNGASNAAFQVPSMGNFNINMVTTPAATPGARAGLDGFIQFTPIAGAPNSNTIGIVQTPTPAIPRPTAASRPCRRWLRRAARSVSTACAPPTIQRPAWSAGSRPTSTTRAARPACERRAPRRRRATPSSRRRPVRPPRPVLSPGRVAAPAAYSAWGPTA
jgi:hypothetical protein